MISVIVPIYKCEAYLRQCVESLIDQTYDDIEIILVDDGSPDACPAICDEYAAKYANVHVVHKENGGSISARKIGLLKAKGDYVTFVDADDWLDSVYCQQAYALIQEYHPDVIAVTNFYSFQNGEAKRESIGAEYNGLYGDVKLSDVFTRLFYFDRGFQFGFAPSLWSKFIKRELLLEHLVEEPESIRMGDDLAVSLPCLLQAKTVYFSDVCGYYYRQNPTSMTNTFDSVAPVRLNVLLDYLQQKTEAYAAFNIKAQLSNYAVYMAGFTLVSLIKGSKNVKADIETFNSLFEHPLLQQGMSGKLALRTRLLFYLAKTKQTWAFRLYRTLKRRRR